MMINIHHFCMFFVITDTPIDLYQGTGPIPVYAEDR